MMGSDFRQYCSEMSTIDCKIVPKEMINYMPSLNALRYPVGFSLRYSSVIVIIILNVQKTFLHMRLYTVTLLIFIPQFIV